MPAPCAQPAGQQRERRSAGKAAELSRRPEEGTKMDGMARRQRGNRPDVEPRLERTRASLAPPTAPSVRISNHGRTRNSAEPSSLKVDERLQLARKRREEHLKQLASREHGWLAREERARKFYEQHLQERRKKLEDHRQREERRRMAVEDKRRQRLKEERERYESVVRRTMERSQKAKQRVGSCTQRGGSGARSKTNAKRRSLSQWEIDLVSRLQTPTVSYLARSRSAICLSKGEAVHVCRRSASCHSVSSSAPQKLRQSCSAPPHRGVTCPGVNSTKIAGPGVNNPNIMGPRVKNSIQSPGVNSARNTGPGVNNPSITGSGVNNPSITASGVNNPDITSPGVNNPDITTPGVNNPDITSPGVNNPDITSPGVNNPDITSPGVNNPDITTPGVNNPDITSPGVNNPDITSPGVNNASQRASGKDQGSNGNLEKTEWKKPQSHTAAAVTANSGTAAHYKTIPSSTGHMIDKPLMRTLLRQVLPKPEGLPPLPEEEDPEPESLLCSTQPPPAHSVALGLCEDAGQDGPDLPEPGSAGPPLPSACPRAASELSLTGVGTQGRTSAGTTDPEEASRLLAEKRRQARIQREREGEERRQMEETGRRGREEQAGAYQPQEERKRKEKEEQRKTQDEEACRQIEEDRRLQLQREVEEARQRVTAERLERESRSQREDAERQQRKKRLEEIMKRTRKTDPAEKKPATSSTTVKDILPNENVKPILSPPLEDVIMFPSPAKASKVGLGSDEDLLPAVAFKERRSLRTLAGLEEVQAHQRAEVI